MNDLPLIYWDASALVKRYYQESGSLTVDAIFDSASHHRMLTTLWGYAETFAILHRKRNGGHISTARFARSVTALQEEVLTASDFGLLTIEDDRVLTGLTYVTRHNLNSADAAILATFVQYAQSLPSGSPTCILAASDQRFLRAAAAEGLATLNPEILPLADVSVFLGNIR